MTPPQTTAAQGGTVRTGYALWGRCDTCGNITAFDLDGSPKHEREMQMKGRTVERVTREEARAAVPMMKHCDHKSLIAELRRQLALAPQTPDTKG